MGQIFWGGVVGWLAARKVKEGTPADLIVAGRCMPLWIATLTMTATWERRTRLDRHATSNRVLRVW